MKNLDKVLKHFNNDLSEWVSFLNEKINDGQEISRGKDPNDVSKQQKRNDVASNAAQMMPGGGEEMGAVPPIIDPSQAPGSQIAIGKKSFKDESDPTSKKIKLSGEEEKINMKPTANTSFNHGTY